MPGIQTPIFMFFLPLSAMWKVHDLQMSQTELCELTRLVQGHGLLRAFRTLNPLPGGQIRVCPFHHQPSLCAPSWHGASLAVRGRADRGGG